LETIGKLMAGLDRLAADLSLIVEYGQPVELRKRAGTDLQKLLSDVAARLNDRTTVTGSFTGSIVIAAQTAPLVGEFDAGLLAQALESISIGALKLRGKAGAGALEIQLSGEANETTSNGVIEWPVPETLEHDPFRSLAGSDGLRLSLAARIVEAHGGSAGRKDGVLRVRLPLTT
jgi:hypothetical protein